ncbi:hypothetical protein CONPUDRAFT_159211 [Coniophora puteana RWD-64-598 SS2]|uniref:Uncharacterized protein n=1 Tax=Coniophora puteana (strain RWD-64-598) TaxID=741705 RepID=A0A5M3M8F8_CONPW|nr:uncharacterized protein CONPUDRAFT_159211 [Coniophora puteana RWD-64-598 SS2]EIW75075.1 hypothetical protein CONPUDRAFT_159211 [Coniophora puteana RWD-64-598 SS2]
MTWTIATVSVPSGKTYTIVGGPDGQEGAFTPGYWFSTKAYLIIPNLGYIQFEDQGNKVPGGDWSVKVSGTSSNWFYGGGGQMKITVNADGSFSITGGQKDTSGKVIAWAI